MRNLFIAILLACVSGHGFLYAQSVGKPQQPSANKRVFTMPDASARGNNAVRFVFYNTENLFDTFDDSLTNDNEYTPMGMRGWSYTKFQRKLMNLSKVFISIGGWEAPEIIGMAEVENRFVLYKLITDTPLNKIGYKIIHKDSPDPRGIDVAMIYRPDKFTPISYKAIPIRFPNEPNSRTRDILYVKGKVLEQETIHIFINHWPSRYGGYTATKPKRAVVASILRHTTDSIIQIEPNARIVIMGDFNDEPNDESITKVLMARSDSSNLDKTDLYNMMAGYATSWRGGTNKFRESWSVIDQIIVSSSLLHAQTGLYANANAAHIFDAPFLLMEDKTYFGLKPFRTYLGPRYQGGFSDHLPIYFDVFIHATVKPAQDK
ncbi:MAG: endonuclease/exonuclease/phosphatase family protein [Bacteroidales bacterium]